MIIKTFKGQEVVGPVDINGYWAARKDHDLYRLMTSIAFSMFPHAKSAIDVGCYTSGLLVEFDWIPKRIASDKQAYLEKNWRSVENVSFVPGDAFELEFGDLFDLVISNQTIEHLGDPCGFVKKLLSIGRSLIISTTYETPAGLIEGHIQDPIDLKKFQSWFPVPLDAWCVCYHPSKKIGHIIGVLRESHPNHTRN